MDSDRDRAKKISQHSLFDEPVDLFHFNQIQPMKSYTDIIHSRRSSYDDNSQNNLDYIFNAKLSMNDTRNSSYHDIQRSILPNISNGSEVPHFPTSFSTTTSDRFPMMNDHYKSWLYKENALYNEDKRVSYGWNDKKESEYPSNEEVVHYGVCSRMEMPSTSFNTPFTSVKSSLYQPYNIAHSFFLPPSPPMSHHQTNKQRMIRRVDTDNRFNNAHIDDYVGRLYELCKDQNGCRFLQKKIEDNNHIQLIFHEIHAHFTELMTDPFGNYLCQKMLAKCDDEQRTIIVETVAPELVRLALNMHGTRAVQKLIEYLSTPEQIHIVTASLNANVVTLIKNLNGNHVIQKCLNRLSSEDNQFIYNAVCDHCIEVASHKHGCCVLQRCFDHATHAQKNQLVDEIARHALTLVQNPFGNYVVQYVLELGISNYSESIIMRFVDHVCLLSVQKFSSNVIEKCIRTAMPTTRRLLINELINESAMEKLLHDSFANYVVQTSLDCADEDQRIQLVECIRPLLPTIRTTPYGKRIHSKIFRDQKSTQCKSQYTRQKHRSSTDEQ